MKKLFMKLLLAGLAPGLSAALAAAQIAPALDSLRRPTATLYYRTAGPASAPDEPLRLLSRRPGPHPLRPAHRRGPPENAHPRRLRAATWGSATTATLWALGR